MQKQERDIQSKEITTSLNDDLNKVVDTLFSMNRTQRRMFAKTRKIPWDVMPKFTLEQTEKSKTWSSNNPRYRTETAMIRAGKK